MGKLLSAWLITILLLVACKNSTQTTSSLFTKLSSSHSGVVFENTIVEDEKINILSYEYTYNGGGVAAADFNNDGWCDLYFVGNAVSNRLYLNRKNLQFQDATEASQTSGRPLWKTGVAVADVNQDGWLDIYVSYSGPVADSLRSNQLFINQGCNSGGIPTFKDQAKEYGLDAPGTFTTQVSFFDYDQDGDLDLFMINHGNHFYSPFLNTRQLRNTRHPQFGNRLYRNNSIENPSEISTFTDVSVAAGIHGGGLNFSLGISTCDVNEDGWPDVYVTNDYEEQDFLYLNQHDGTFLEATKESLFHISRNGMGTDIADYNNDGKVDIMTLDMWPEDNYRQKLLKGPDDRHRYKRMVDSGYHHQQMRNTLQLQRGLDEKGIPIFSEIGQLAGVSATDWSWSPLFVDLDNDGWKDLFVTNGYLRDFTSMDFLKFTVEEEKKKAQAAGKELKLDEVVKKMTSTKTSDYVFRNNRNLTFSNTTKEWGLQSLNLSFGSTYADLDNDGDLELITNNTNEESTIWENHSSTITSNHFIRIRLLGNNKNRLGIGAKIKVYTNGGLQIQEQSISRGYQSSVEPTLHFGIGSSLKADSISVIWPDGKLSQLKEILPNQTIDVDYTNAQPVNNSNNRTQNYPYFEDVTKSSNVNWKHNENEFEDYDYEPLLPYRLSRLGPPLAVGDVNKDGEDDFYHGGAAGQSGRLFIADGKGAFLFYQNQPWEKDSASEDAGSVFFDADGDADLDLFVVSGGNEYPKGSPELQDRLYINLGNGKFFKAEAEAIIKEQLSGSCVVAADYDKDGDIDLYVGGRITPRNFPITAPGAVLENVTEKTARKIKFRVATQDVNPLLREPGMVTDAIWSDYNNDTWPDLILVGDWMPIRIFRNEKGKLNEVKDSTLHNSTGLWKRIEETDLDNDGDKDYIIGNAGINFPFKATTEEPLFLYYDDFNKDGKIDPIIASYNRGKLFPIASRDELLGQLPSLRKRFLNYDSYSKSELKDIFTENQLSQAKKINVKTLSSSILINVGNGKFDLIPLPTEAQFSSVDGIVISDFDSDGVKDLFMTGNSFSIRSSIGPSDSNIGLLLKGHQGFFIQPSGISKNIFVSGDVKNMKILGSKKSKAKLVIGINNMPIQIISTQIH
jgi:hypothetical protein